MFLEIACFRTPKDLPKAVVKIMADSHCVPQKLLFVFTADCRVCNKVNSSFFWLSLQSLTKTPAELWSLSTLLHPPFVVFPLSNSHFSLFHLHPASFFFIPLSHLNLPEPNAPLAFRFPPLSKHILHAEWEGKRDISLEIKSAGRRVSTWIPAHLVIAVSEPSNNSLNCLPSNL